MDSRFWGDFATALVNVSQRRVWLMLDEFKDRVVSFNLMLIQLDLDHSFGSCEQFKIRSFQYQNQLLTTLFIDESIKLIIDEMINSRATDSKRETATCCSLWSTNEELSSVKHVTGVANSDCGNSAPR